ncbi:glycosyl transferase [Alicyclobacillus hesperidum subsp. aegles]|uniref:glycosyltransferase family 2 protein n=1 Tax=Alicyclobacillus hesperidum TaxID=89784 RepID=UPI0007193CAB|nr:glycosyltransferase family 2 protein [Alicyclobacillus hesperidum]KRW92059.1 glycosyl transferase family protein [Alicyclobacillus tengchongensis]GLG00858.1 glycosyl transferase [Alicyclobacillus hesperidum subsp. aegles]
MRIAVLIPCYNEELTIGKVIADFRRELPDADIYVYDNNSRDRTADIARAAGAIVRREVRQGKGNVVRSMFRDIDADIYVMIDGDDTYPAEFVHDLIQPVAAGEADMSIGDRHSDGSYSSENKRPFHNFGNQFVKALINRLFRSQLRDIMTGYRVFNRRFAKTMPIQSEGFEIETEMTLHALDKRFRIIEIPIRYRDRPPGSESKLNTVSDGIRVLKTVFWIFKDYKPLAFFGTVALLFFIAGLAVGIPVITEFFASGRIAKMPSAILAVGLMVLATNSLTCGFILDTIVRNHRDNYELLQNEFKD